MTRVPSVSALKGNARSLGRVGLPPPEGGRLRGFYDRLRKGEHINFFVELDRKGAAGFQARNTLQTDYGMDIRRVSYGFYALAGEWDGGKYIPLDALLDGLASIDP